MGKTKTGAAKKRRPYLQLSRRGTYGSLLLIVLACGWMFFVGVLVGRGTAPIRFDMEALSRELKALKASSEDRRRRQLESYAAALEDQSTLDVYEELKRADDELTIDPGLSRQVPAPSAPKKVPPAVKSAEPEAIRVIRRRDGLQAKTHGRIGVKVRPDAGSKKSPAAAAGPQVNAPGAQRGKLTLQVAAVKEDQVARQMVDRLRHLGFDAYQSKTTLPGQGIWYRVRVGRYADRQSAASIKRRLEGQGLAPIMVAY